MSRWQVVVGKFIGHISILAITIFIGYGSTGLYLLLSSVGGGGDWSLYFSMMCSSLLLGAVFVAVGHLLSVLVNDRATAGGLAVGVWLFMVVIFDLLLLGLLLTNSSQNLAPTLLEALLMLNPADVYRLFNVAGSEAAGLLAAATSMTQPVTASPTALLAVLLLWAVLPLTAAILVFQRREL